MNLQCTNCGKDIIKSTAQIKRSKTGNMYCSRSCSASKNNSLFKKWINHPQYKSGERVYRKNKFDSIKNPVCEKCGYDNILALDIHHIDRNRKNNNLDNLQILCCNCHRLEHRKRVVG